MDRYGYDRAWLHGERDGQQKRTTARRKSNTRDVSPVGVLGEPSQSGSEVGQALTDVLVPICIPAAE
jgi:creatinine amidohydrolase/Fe(II)-dependent formamide hydrolase-like protein